VTGGTRIFFTDIVGSTVLWEQQSERMTRAFAGRSAQMESAWQVRRAATRAAVGEEKCAACCASGYAMTLEAAVRVALEPVRSTAGFRQRRSNGRSGKFRTTAWPEAD
jgi:hypothetical protein